MLIIRRYFNDRTWIQIYLYRCRLQFCRCGNSGFKGLVILDGLKVNDGRANSSGTIAGAINFENLSSLGINLIIQADDLLLLNTSQKDFDTFWGRVNAKGIINISGLSSKLNIDAKAAVLGGRIYAEYQYSFFG
jgi:hypothetical protein